MARDIWPGDFLSGKWLYIYLHHHYYYSFSYRFFFFKTLPGALRGPCGSRYILLVEPLGTKVPSFFGRERLHIVNTTSRIGNRSVRSNIPGPFLVSCEG
jgi:hypothetical protein